MVKVGRPCSISRMDPELAPPQANPSTPLPPRFWLTLWLVGVGYMLLMWAISQGIGATGVLDIWWWTAIPVAWIGAFVVHWRQVSAIAKWRDTFLKHPSYGIFLCGMVPILLIVQIATPPSSGGLSDSQLLKFEVAVGVLFVIAVLGGGFVRRLQSARKG